MNYWLKFLRGAQSLSPSLSLNFQKFTIKTRKFLETRVLKFSHFLNFSQLSVLASLREFIRLLFTKLPSFWYMVVWAQTLSSLRDLLRKMKGPRFSTIYGSMEAIKFFRNRLSAGLCSLKDSDSRIGILEEGKPLGNGRMVVDFGKFPTWQLNN